MKQSTLDRHRSLRRSRAEQRLARLERQFGIITRATEISACPSCRLRVELGDQITANGWHVHCAIDSAGEAG